MDTKFIKWYVLISFVILCASIQLAQESGILNKQNVKERAIIENDNRGLLKEPVHITLPAPLKTNHNETIPGKQLQEKSGSSMETIMSEDFEGAFPPYGWSLNDDAYTWGKRTYYSHGGTGSAWAVGGGTSGSLLNKDANYPNNISTLLVYGPFDLSDANYASFSFYLWLNSQTNYDYFQYMVSSDGTDFYGYALSGTTGGEWFPYSLPLTVVPENENFVDYTGNSSVYIAFGFFSNNSTTMPNGAFIDDVTLQKGNINTPVILNSFPTPGQSSRGLTFDGTNLWCSDATNHRIYKLDSSGGILTSFVTPGSYPSGLAWDADNLWHADYMDARIYKLSSSGSILSSFPSPGITPSGLSWNGSNLLISDLSESTIWQVNSTGNVINSFTATGTYHYGLAWDGQNIWMVDADLLLIIKMNTQGNVLDYIMTPGTFPAGLVWDGSALLLTDRDTDLIYKLEVQSYTNDLGVTEIDMPDLISLGSSATVNITIINYGIAAQSNFPVNYNINNGPAITENFNGSIGAGQTAMYTFTTEWEPQAEGTYHVSSWTSLSGDENPSDDHIAVPKEVTVYMSGQISLSIDNINESVDFEASRNVDIYISNNGFDTLTYSANVSGGTIEGTQWLNLIAPTSGNISPGESAKLTASLTAVRENTSLNGEINITSNDPGNPLVTIPVNMTVPHRNSVPEIITIPDQVMIENSILSIIISSSDADTNNLRLSVNNLPDFGTLTDNGDGTGSIVFSAGAVEQQTLYPDIRVIVTDDGTPNCSDTTTFTLTVENVTGIDDECADEIPDEYVLMQNFPNPFNPNTEIRFGLPQASVVLIEIYSIMGEKMQTLADRQFSAGYHSVEFDGRDLASGMYLCIFSANEYKMTLKMLLVK